MATETSPQSARAKLGEVIKYHREKVGFDHRTVSRVCGASVSDVEAWERGALVPTSDQWGRLKRAVNHALRGFAELYQRARQEQLDDRARIERSLSAHAPKPTPVVVNLGDKLREALPSSSRPAADAPVTQPAPEVRRRKPSRIRGLPPGIMTAEAVAARREFARNVLRQRPHIRERGADSLDELLVQRFGIGISPDAARNIRAQVLRERDGGASTPVVAPPAPAPVRQPTAPPREVNASDVAAAVELILGAVPSLRTFTIVVDDSGEASVDYTVREVVVRETGGSLKVRR
jgi:hypothetical protein